MAVVMINDGAVQVDYLELGDMTVRVVGSEEARTIINEICKGRGRWSPKFKNYIISKEHAETVLSDIVSLSSEDD